MEAVLHLERARLVKRTKVGRDHFLKFHPQPLTQAKKWMEQQQAFWQASLDALDDLLQKEDGKQ